MSKENTQRSYEHFLRTFSGKELLKKHKLTDKGLWRIRGEDPNCDLGGYHSQPDLGTVEGTLQNVIEYAVLLKNFWTWGYGGDITSVTVAKIDDATNKRRVELEQEAANLEARLQAINTELREL